MKELNQYAYRQVWSACIFEAINVFEKEGLHIASPNMFPVVLFGYLLLLPDWIFYWIARFVFRVEEDATSSMYEDLKRGRETEILFLQGEVVRMGDKIKVETPVCLRVCEAVQKANGLGRVDPYDLLR
jgi:2-dehydropantoate 2-reductase